MAMTGGGFFFLSEVKEAAKHYRMIIKVSLLTIKSLYSNISLLAEGVRTYADEQGL